MSECKAVIKTVDMPYEMQQYAMDCATLAYTKYKDKLVCHYSEVMCLVGWLFGWFVGCELPNIDTLLFFSGYCTVYKRRI